MSKPKAPVWLRESFRDGVDERNGRSIGTDCELAVLDPLGLPCSGPSERYHWINRQRIENAMGAMLPTWQEIHDPPASQVWWFPSDLILLAAWDPRVGGIACEGHHRRLDGHAMPPLLIPYDALPSHVIDWASDYGMESQLEARCPRLVPQ